MSELETIAGDDCTLVVLDSVGEFLSAHGANENWDTDVSKWLFAFFARRLAAAGPAVVLIDHDAKGSDGSSSAGSKRKRAGLTGASYNVYLENEADAWTRERGGFAIISTRKDRHGVRARGSIAAFVECIPSRDDDPLRVLLTSNQPTGMEPEDDPFEVRVVQFIAGEPDGVTRNYVSDQLDISHEQTSAVLQSLAANGVIVQRSKRWHVAAQPSDSRV